MKRLPSLLLTLCVAAASAHAQDKPLAERAAEALQSLKRDAGDAADVVARKAREGISATKEYLSKNPSEHRQAAAQRVSEISEELAELQKRAATQFQTRAYLKSRMQSLQEQHVYVQAELQKLPADGAQPAYDTAREPFDRALQNLEGALDQMQEELQEGA
jgi:leucyl aminopeptidase (aminopeptidase T)